MAQPIFQTLPDMTSWIVHKSSAVIILYGTVENRTNLCVLEFISVQKLLLLAMFIRKFSDLP
jgi:hypothetical protein